jgi:hypothetical protein
LHRKTSCRICLTYLVSHVSLGGCPLAQI